MLTFILTKKLSKSILLLILVSFLVGAACNQFRVSFSWSYDSWQITEWLINYAGGFVRRGLPGEILRSSSRLLNINANEIAIFISFFLYVILFVFLLNKTNKKFSPFLIFSSIVMGAPAYQDFIVRKDVLVVVLFLLGIKLATIVKGNIINSIFLAFLCAAAILTHESFFFVAIPSVLLVLFCNARSCSSKKMVVDQFAFVIVAIVAIISFSFVVAFKGNSVIAFEINQSWFPLWKKLSVQECCFDRPSAAIDGIGWTTMRGLSLTAGLLKTFSWGIYVPFAWLLTIVFCYWMIVQSVISNCVSDRKIIARILLFQLTCISPLFVLGWDYGRWIFLWSTSSLILFVFHSKVDFLNKMPTSWLAEKTLNFSIFNVKPNFYVLLFFGVPVCCWSVVGYVKSSPIGYYLIYFSRVIGS